MKRSILRYFLVVALLLGLLIAPMHAVRAQGASVWDGTYPATRPTGMDDGAGDLTIDIYTAEEFAWIMSVPNMFLDGVSGVNKVLLHTDIDLASHPWTPSVAAGPSQSNTFDGGGHTIRNLFVDGGTYQSSNNRYFLGLFGRVPNAAHAKIQNLTVDGAVLNGSTTVRSYAGVITGSEDWMGHYENVHVKNATITASKYVGAIAAYGTSNMTNISAENITFNVTEIGSDMPHVGGLIGLNNAGTLENATVTNLTINITADDGNLETYQVGTLIGTAQKDVVINPNSKATNVTYNNNPYTNIVGLDNREDKSWYDPAGDNYLITTVEQLKGLDNLLNAGTNFSGKTVLLGADINLYGQSFFPLGSYAKPFQGTFDGQDRTLSNLSLTQTTNYAGFFARVFGGSVKNLRIDNFNIKGPEYVGGVAGEFHTASFDNIHVSNSTILSDHFGGGVTGYLYGNAKNSSVTNVTVKAHNELPGELGNKLGGLAGYVGEGAYILENNTGTSVTVIGLRDVGGLFGTTQAGNKVYTNTITNSTVTASNQHGTETNAWAGGIVGRLGGASTTFRGNLNTNTTVTSYNAGQAGPIYGGPAANAIDYRVFNQTQSTWHTSISAAITAAAENDVLFAGPGIYPENIVIDKKITLNGAGENSAFGATPATIQGLVSIEADGVTINDLKVAPGSVTGQVAAVKISASNVTLNRNLIDGMTGDGTATIKGIHVYSHSGITNITIEDNVVKNITNPTNPNEPSKNKGADGIMVQGFVDGVTINDNTVENIYSAGWAYGIEVTPTGGAPSNPPQNVTITGNTVRNVNSAGQPGVSLTIDVYDADHPADASEVTLHRNKFLDSPYAIVNKDTAHQLDATANFFGLGIEPGNVILGDVDWIPFYGDEGMLYLVDETTLDIETITTNACGTATEVTIAVNVGPVSYTSSYEMNFQFDPEKVEIVNAYNGNVFTGDLMEEEYLGNGLYVYGNTTIGSGGNFSYINDPDGGVLMYLKVKLFSPGTSTITLLGTSYLTIGDDVLVDHPYNLGENEAIVDVGNPVISIGTNLYCDLQSAVTAAATGNTLTVLRDFTTTGGVFIDKKITFDTNGKTVSRTNANDWYSTLFAVMESGDMTIKGSGTVMSTDTAGTHGAAVVVYGGKLSLEEATLSGGYASVSVYAGYDNPPTPGTFNMISGTITDGVHIAENGSQFNMSGGTIQITENKFAIAGNGSAGYGGTIINISGDAKVISEQTLAIFHPQDGTLTISGNAEISGPSAIQMKSGDLTISGTPTITATGTFVANPEPPTNGAQPTGDAIFIVSQTNYTGDLNLNISGGTITSANGYAVREFVGSGTTKLVNATISDGQLSGGAGAVVFASNTDAILDLIGAAYSTDPKAFVYAPKYSYLDNDGWYRIGDMVGPVVGTVSMQARTVRAGVPVTLTGAVGGTHTATSTEAVGPNLSFALLAPDTYTITTAQPRYLNIYTNLGKTKTINGTNLVIAPLRLIAGNAVMTLDANGYDVINHLDAGNIGTHFMETGDDISADVNFDGIVNIRDLALVGGNYGLTNATAYQNWTP